jgi:carbon starvation protein
LHFNNVLDAAVAGSFLVLVVMIVVLSSREWLLLIARRRLAVLHEADPVWLPDYALAQGKPLPLFSLLALALGLARELSGEAALDRAQLAEKICDCAESRHRPAQGGVSATPLKPATDARSKRGTLFAKAEERRFNGVSRCC